MMIFPLTSHIIPMICKRTGVGSREQGRWDDGDVDVGWFLAFGISHVYIYI